MREIHAPVRYSPEPASPFIYRTRKRDHSAAFSDCRRSTRLSTKPSPSTPVYVPNDKFYLGDQVFTPKFPSAIRRRSAKGCYICQHCFDFVVTPGCKNNCQPTEPPDHGVPIYNDPTRNLVLYEIYAKDAKPFAMRFVRFGRLFIDDKLVDPDLDTFIFYLLYKIKNNGVHEFIGYFSRERNPEVNISLSCIAVMPYCRGHGYGFLLIDISYAIARRDDRLGGPESPLSESGELIFKKYWRSTLLLFLYDCLQHDIVEVPSSVISRVTGIHRQDLIQTLEEQCVIRPRSDEALVTRDRVLRFHTRTKNANRLPIFDSEYLTWRDPIEAIPLMVKQCRDFADRTPLYRRHTGVRSPDQLVKVLIARKKELSPSDRNLVTASNVTRRIVIDGMHEVLLNK